MTILISNTSLSTFFSSFNVRLNYIINGHKLLRPVTLHVRSSDLESKERKQYFNSKYKEFSDHNKHISVPITCPY